MQQNLLPLIDRKTAQDLLILAQNKANQVSNNQLRIFEPGSPVSAILEANALACSEVILQVNQIASTLESKMLSYFNLSKNQALPSGGTVNIILDGLYPDLFVLPSGFRFRSQNISFVTNSDVIIQPYQSSGTTSATALVSGGAGNISASSSIEYTAISRVSAIQWLGDVQGGVSEETESQWRDRVYRQLQRRSTLISESDFELAVTDYLGNNSISLAIGRLKPDKIGYDNGYVAVFGLNSNGLPLNQGQIADLGNLLNNKAAMALVSVWSMETQAINLNVVVNIEENSDPYTIGSNIKNAVLDYLFPGRLEPGVSILNKAIEYKIQTVTGVVQGMVSVKINDLAQPLPLANKWTVAKVNEFKLVVIRNSVEFTV